MSAPTDPIEGYYAQQKAPTAREYARQVMEHDRESWSRLDAAVILAARVEAVLALHVKSPDHPGECAGCIVHDWPCPTVRLLNGEQS